MSLDTFIKPVNQEWYKEIGYEDSLVMVRENFQDAAKSFITIGYCLKHIKEKKLYKKGNYSDIWECAYKEFGLSKSAASRYININTAFSVNGNTPLLAEKYNSFSKSQLQEMLALPEDIRNEIKPENTVAEIRNIIKEKKKADEPTEEEIRTFYDKYILTIGNESGDILKGKLKERFKNTDDYADSIVYSGSSRGIAINNKDEITWGHLARLIQKYYPLIDNEKKVEEYQLSKQMNIQSYSEILPEAMPVQRQKMKTVDNNEGQSIPEMMKNWLINLADNKLSAEEALKGFVKYYVLYDNVLLENVRDDILNINLKVENIVEYLQKILKDYCS